MSESNNTIRSQVDEFNEKFDAQIGAELADTFASEQANLREYGPPVGVVGVGDKLPATTLLSRTGGNVKLFELLSSTPAILVFYRGAWCPYCNITLRTYQRELLPALTQQGMKLVAISPQHPAGTEASIQGGDLGFDVLSDPANRLAKALGIVTEPSPEARAAHTQLGFEVSDSNADKTAAVPFPTVLLVDGGGTVRFADVHTDYTSRTEVDEILAAARSL